MSANKPQQTAWHTSAAVSSAPLIEQSAGDGLNSMRSLRAKYAARATELEILMTKFDDYALAPTIDFYGAAVSALDALLEDCEDSSAAA